MTQSQTNNMARSFLSKIQEAEQADVQQALAQGVQAGGQAGMADGYAQGVADATSPRNINVKLNQYKQGVVSTLSSTPKNMGGM